MRNITQETNFVSVCGMNLPINTGNSKYHCYTEILSALDSQMSAMLFYHSKLLIVRVDLHTDDITSDNHKISKFARKLRKRLKQKYKLKRVGYVWVREWSKQKKLHYHLAVFVDGHKLKSDFPVTRLSREIWENWNYGHVPFIPKPFHRVKRNHDKQYRDAFYRLSYMAKKNQKLSSLKSSKANHYGASQIQPKQAEQNIASV